MKPTVKAILIAVFFCTAHMAMACERPAEMEVPNGTTATKADMVAAGLAYRRYMDDMLAYQECLAVDAEQARPKSKNAAVIAQHQNSFVAKHNAASDAMSRVTEKFNQAIAAYESRQ